jgi:hypothetical protein
MRGHNGTVVALDPGRFWNNRRQKIFNASITASVALVRRIQPALPFLIRHPAGSAALLAQFSARPWKLDPDLVLTELRGFNTSPSLDEAGKAMAHGPKQPSAPRFAPGEACLDGAGRTRSRCPSRQKSARHCIRRPRCTGSKTAGISRIGTSLWRQQSSSSSRRSRQVVKPAANLLMAPLGRDICAVIGRWAPPWWKLTCHQEPVFARTAICLGSRWSALMGVRVAP